MGVMGATFNVSRGGGLTRLSNMHPREMGVTSGRLGGLRPGCPGRLGAGDAINGIRTRIAINKLLSPKRTVNELICMRISINGLLSTKGTINEPACMRVANNFN